MLKFLVSDPIPVLYQHQDKHPDSDIYVLGLGRKLERGKSYSLKLEYLGKYGKNTGLYLSEDGDGGYMTNTQFESTFARWALPCFDEPAMKATFQLTLGRPFDYYSISNMPIIGSLAGMLVDGVDYEEDIYQVSTLYDLLRKF